MRKWKSFQSFKFFFLLNEKKNILFELREYSGYLSINKTNNNNM